MGSPKIGSPVSPSSCHVAIPINDVSTRSPGRSHGSLWESWTRGISGGKDALAASRDRLLMHIPLRSRVEERERRHMAEEEREERRSANWRGFVLATWLLAGLAVAVAGATWLGTRKGSSVEEACAGVAYHMTESWQENRAQVAALKVLLETFYVNLTVPILTPDLFRQYTAASRSMRPSVSTLLYADRLSPSAARTSLLRGTKLQSSRPFYAPVLFNDTASEVPDTGVRDLYDEVDLREAMESAEDAGEAAISVPMISGNRQNVTSVLVFPFFSPASNASDIPSTAKQKTAVGWLLATFEFGLLVETAVESARRRHPNPNEFDLVRFWMYDVTNTSDLRILYTSENRIQVANSNSTDLTIRSLMGSVVEDVNFGDPVRKFEVRCSRKQASSFPFLALVWAVVVVLVTIVVATVLRFFGRRILMVERAYGQMRAMRDQTLGDKLAAEAADSYKSQFLATVSHEIRTPLNGVLGMLTLLRDTKLDATQLDYVQTAVSSGKALIGLINDVLDFSKIEAGKMEIDSVAFNIRREVDDVLSLFAEKVRNNGIELAALVQLAVPTMVVGDSGRFRQVLINLVGNATKFTESGHILVTIRQLDDGEDFQEIHSLPAKPITTETYFLDEEERAPLSPPRDPPFRPRRSSLSSLMTSSVATFLTQSSQYDDESKSGNLWMGPLFREQASDKKKGWKHAPGSKQSSKTLSSKGGSQGNSQPLVEGEGGAVGGAGTVRYATLSGKPAASGAHTYDHVLKWMHQKPAKGNDGKAVRLGIAVEDTGNGIPLVAQSHIFQPFRQADSSTNRKSGGTGIGLSISKCLVELQGGKIAFVSRPSIGSTFFFDIRLAVVDPHLPSPTLPPASVDPVTLPHVSALPGLRVLLVDTSRVRRTVLSNHLRALGVLADMADSPQQAISMAESLSLPYEECIEQDESAEMERRGEGRRGNGKRSSSDGQRDIGRGSDGEIAERGGEVEEERRRGGRRSEEGGAEQAASAGGPELKRVKSFEALLDLPLGKSRPSKRLPGGGRRRSMEAMVDVAKSLSISRFSPFSTSSVGSLSPSFKDSPVFMSSQLQNMATFLSAKEQSPYMSPAEKTKFRSAYAAIFIDMDARDWTNGGLELGEMARESHVAGIPLVLVARRVEKAQQEMVQKLGFKAVLLKPLRTVTVALALGKALGFTSAPVSEPKASAASATSAQLAEILKGKCMLCVDDNLVNRRVAAKFLGKYGVEAICLPGGESALEHLKEKGDMVDLVLMDLQMPQMDGFEASQKIRELEKSGTLGALGPNGRHLPIVAMTADVLKGTREKCLEAGMDGFITKPIDPTELLRVVSKFFPLTETF